MMGYGRLWGLIPVPLSQYLARGERGGIYRRGAVVPCGPTREIANSSPKSEMANCKLQRPIASSMYIFGHLVTHAP